MCQEKKEEDLPTFKIALMHRYKDSKTTHTSAKQDCLQPSETIQTTRGSTETEITWKQKWEEKQLGGYFKRLTNEILHEKIWTWLKKGKP